MNFLLSQKIQIIIFKQNWLNCTTQADFYGFLGAFKKLPILDAFTVSLYNRDLYTYAFIKSRSNSKKNMSNNFEKKKKTNLIYSTIFEKILNQQISNGIDDKSHVVSISNASQMAIGLWPRFFLFFEFSRYILYTWMVILWASIVRKGNCDGCSFDLFLKNEQKN